MNILTINLLCSTLAFWIAARIYLCRGSPRCGLATVHGAAAHMGAAYWIPAFWVPAGDALDPLRLLRYRERAG